MTSTPILCSDSIAQWQSVHILSGGARVRFPDDAVQYLAFGEKYWDIMYDQHTHIMYRFHSSMVEHPHSIRGGLGSIPGRCSSIFSIWREVLGYNVYIISQYLTPTIIYRDIIYALYPSSTPPPKTTAIFRDFKKSTAMCKVHNVGLRYINKNINQKEILSHIAG